MKPRMISSLSSTDLDFDGMISLQVNIVEFYDKNRKPWVYYFKCSGREESLHSCPVLSLKQSRDTCTNPLNVECYNDTGGWRMKTSLPNSSHVNIGIKLVH